MGVFSLAPNRRYGPRTASRQGGSAIRSLRRALVLIAFGASLCACVNAAGSGVRASAQVAAPAQAAVASCAAQAGNALRPISQVELGLLPVFANPALGSNGQDACVGSITIPTPSTPVPTTSGQVILVSIQQQWLWAYQDGQLVFATPITTGRPELRTPAGTFHIARKLADTTFYSPWPKGSPYYYDPLHINYALLFRAGGFYIHDAPWREMFGPGTNLPHTLPDGTTETGSHGCVNVPTAAAAWLYGWAHVGTQVTITAPESERI